MNLGGSLVLYCENCTLENGLTVQIYKVFITGFFNFLGKLPSDPPNFIIIKKQKVILSDTTFSKINFLFVKKFLYRRQ
jgi:hypothetical protein